MACSQYYVVSRVIPTASTPQRDENPTYTSRQSHESRRPIYSKLKSHNFPPIKFRSFQFKPTKSIIISTKTTINCSSDQNPIEISKKDDMGLLDLEKHFAFYGAYHSNPVNVLIHMIFVWPILFASLMLLYYTPKMLPFEVGNGVLVFNLGFVSTVLYSLYYVALDKKAGSLAGLMCFVCWVSSSYLCHQLGSSLSWKVAVAAQIFCWTGQFLGHGLFEKRAPALLDNLSQAFLMAPFFVLLEALQSFFNYEPYPGFHSRVKAKIDADIKEWHEKKKHKKLT